MKQLVLIAAFIGFAFASTAQVTDTVGYKASIEAWHQQRMTDLKRPNGWLNLVGLHWLHEGRNSFGSGAKNDIVFPAGRISREAGYFEVSGQHVILHANPASRIEFDGKEVSELVQFDADSVKERQVKSGSLRWTIIKRQDKLGIRLRDDKSKVLSGFKGTEQFPVDPQYRFDARFEGGDSTRTISINNKIGQTLTEKSPGTLVFTYAGKEYRLDALDEGQSILIVFADRTTGKETYGAGRFLTLKKPSPGDHVTLDFNKSYNPPCVFTPYATCPLPPPQNRLPFAVRAGEKNYAEHY